MTAASTSVAIPKKIKIKFCKCKVSFENKETISESERGEERKEPVIRKSERRPKTEECVFHRSG